MSEADDLLGPPPGGGSPQATAPAPSEADQLLGPAPKTSFGSANRSVGQSLTNITDAIGGAVKDAFSEDQFSEEAVKALKQAKIFNDVQQGQQTLMGSFNEAVLRPVINAGELVARAGAAGLGAYQAGVSQIGEEIGQPQLGRDLAALPEDVMARGNLGPASIYRANVGRLSEADMAAARQVRLDDVTPGEKPAPLTPEEMRAPEASSGGPEGAEPAPPKPPADIHEAARQAAPEVMQHYDALKWRQDTWRGYLDQLEQQRQAPIQEQIDTILGKVNGVEDRLTNKAADKLEDLRSQLNTATDTPEMREVRQALQQNDYMMRDLAPAVSDAYRRGQDLLPEQEKAPPAKEGDSQSALDAPETRAETDKKGDAQAAEPSTTEAHIQAIKDDVAQQLIKAGRPAEEAQAAAELIASHYDSRAARFDGAKGSALDLYNAEAPEIKAGRQKVKEFTQPEKSEFNQGRLPDSDSLFNPRIPTAAEMAVHSRVQDVPLKQARGTQGKMEWQKFEAGDHPGALIDGYDDKPVAVRKEDGEYLIYDGHHRAAQALSNGDVSLSMHVIDAKDYDPSAAGRKKSEASSGWTSDDDALLAELTGDTKEYNQSARGKIRINPETGKSVITLMKDANASTFIHETGHQWLEELMGDAKDEAAPADLTKDAQTVRDWLGAKGSEDITRAQHEQFARGFERYMMEGRAPSAGLRRVFEQFRDWLTKIYQTVNKLRSPINDDIRDVFDRLIAKNPERQEAALSAKPDLLATIHETDATHTPPQHAGEVADRVESEIEETLNDGGRNGTAAADHGAEPADIDRAGGTTGQGKSNALSEGADQPEAEGAGVRAGAGSEDEPGGGATAGESGPSPAIKPGGAGSPTSEPPESAEHPFVKTATPLVDKAGNIRLENLNTPEDVNQVIRDIAAQNGDFFSARRGVLTLGEQMDLADALGTGIIDQAQSRRLGEAFNAEQILALRKTLIQSATSVRDLMQKVFDGGSPQDVAAFAEARARHIMIQEAVSGVTAEAGRALAAFRNIEGFQDAQGLSAFLKETQGLDLFQMKEMAERGSTLKTPAQMSKFISDSNKPSFRDKILFYYVNALISGPLTHARYSVGNLLSAISTPLIEIPAAAAAGKIAAALGRETGERVYLGEAKAQLSAMTLGARNGLSAAADAWKTGVSPLLPGEHVSAHYGENAAIPISGKLGQVIGVPVKSVAAIHSFFKALRYEQNIAGLAYRTAMNEGLEGADFQRRIADLVQRPTDDMMNELGELDPDKMAPGQYENVQAAAAETMKTLYMGQTDFNSFSGKLNAAINSNLLAKVIVPFMKIGSQITREAFLERTPLGFADPEVRANLLGKNGAAAADFQRGKVAFGTALIGATSAMVAEGMATGDGPSDPGERAVWLLSHRPNSIAIGGITIPYQGLGHIGMLMRFGANMTETASGWNEQDGGELAKGFMEGLTRSVLDENFMRGVKDMLDAVYHPTEYGAQYVRSFVTNWLPYSVGLGQVARAVDPYQRVVQDRGWENGFGILDTAQAKVPWLSEGLMPRRDVFGEPIAGDISKYANDPVVQQLDALQHGISKIPKQIMGIDLTPEQHDDYARVSGRMTKMMLDNLVATKGWDTVSDWAKSEVIQKTVDAARKSGRAYVLSSNPTILRQAIEDKRADIMGTR